MNGQMQIEYLGLETSFQLVWMYPYINDCFIWSAHKEVRAFTILLVQPVINTFKLPAL